MTLTKAPPRQYASRKPPSSTYDDTPSYPSQNKPHGSSRGCGKVFLIGVGVFVIIGIISFIVDNSSSSKNSSYSSSSSYSSTSTISKPTTTTTTNSTTCKGSDGRTYTKPIHAYCDGGKTPQGRVCNAGYTAKSENDQTWVQSSWYCQCNKSVVSCSLYTSCIEPNDLYVNQYSQSSVDAYNRKVEAYNRCLSEKCSCSY